MKKWVTSNNLSIALTISLAVHAVLLSLRLAAPEQFDRLFENTALDVILVNSRAQSPPPVQAQALAQTQLAGGGEQAKGRATSPLPTAPDTTEGSSAETMQRQLKALQNEQALLLAQIKQSLSALPPPQPKKELTAQDPVEEKRRQMLKLLGEIEERINQENARPRKHYVSPATREVPFALYYDALRQKIEERGTRYFPEHDGQKLYGELTMIITVHTDGRVLRTEVVQSSGQPELDRRAQAIATAAGPFGSFTREMRQQADQLAVVSRFIFSRDNTLRTQGGESAH
jgi:periplasmic protein TonB